MTIERDNCLRIAIVGIDGSGKSTCFKEVMEELSGREVAGVGDEVLISKNGRLLKPKIKYREVKILLGRRVKNIRNRTLYKILKLCELILRVRLQDEIEKRYRPEIILTDGSPLINIIGWGRFYYSDIFSKDLCKNSITYMSGTKIPSLQRGFYLRNLPEILFINMLGIRFQKPDIVFFLKVKPEVALKRIRKRGRNRQVHETVDFLGKLQKAYQLVCNILSKDSEVYTIDTEEKTTEQVVDILLNRIG